MKIINCTVLFLIISILSLCQTYRILGVFPLQAKSHFMMFEQLMKGLAERGHRVDVVSHFPLEKPFSNYTDVVSFAGSTAHLINNITYEFVKEHLLGDKPLVYSIATQFGGDLCDFMAHPKFQEIMKNPPKDPPYDLVITEIGGSACYYVLGPHLNVPVVGAISSTLMPWANDIIANPDEPAYVPHIHSGLDGKMNFWQRMTNALGLIAEKLKFNYYTADQDEKVKKYIGPNAPSFKDAEKNVSIILVNTHFSLNDARPLTTAAIEVGGLHIPKNVEPLPKDLQQWLDDSEDGFVYISFGSMVKIESLPKKFLDVLYASLAKLAPVRVLMKIAKPEELPSGLPSNVLTRSWIAQMAVLKHENIRAFMTHGGLMGTQESVYCGVPMIGVPLFGDQISNVKRYVRKNIAVALDIDQLTEGKLDLAFKTVINDPSYMEAAKMLSLQFRDRPMHPLDTAVFWVEYVIRHGGRNLGSPALDLTWWQIALLDVYGALFLSITLTVYLMIFVIKKVVVSLSKSSAKRVTSRKKQA